MTLSEDQQLALDIMLQPDKKLIFLTGPAGTGKSFTISRIPAKTKRVAPTGIAAQLIKGTTIHRFLGIRPKAMFANPQTFEKRVRGRTHLIVDEVSMMGYELFDLFMRAYRMSEWRGTIVFTGDFRQLPPVKDDPCYLHPEWDNVVQVQLSEMHRQSDQLFLDVLNDLRLGERTQRLLDFIEQRTLPEPPKNCVKLAAHRETVGHINLSHLQDLLADNRPYKDYYTNMRILSPYYDEDKAKKELLKNGRFPIMLRICRGVRVVLLTNSETWVNGTTGTVKHYTDEVITIEGDDGTTHRVRREWESIQDGDDRTIVEHCQFPMNLAFALTIHKSQGMTLNKVHVDLNNHFAEGQTYVAISRATSPDRISFTGKLSNLRVRGDIPHD